MTRSFVISTIANRDIEAIADYLEENRGFETSDRFIKGMTDRLTQLTQFPKWVAVVTKFFQVFGVCSMKNT